MFNVLGNQSTVESLWRRQDWFLTATALILTTIGSVLVWAATRPRQLALEADPNAYLKKQLMFTVASVVLAVVVSRAKYPLLRAYTPILYIAGLVGLLLVLLPGVGQETNGIRAWIPLPGGFTLQPSEFAKLAIVIGMALVLSETSSSTAEPGNREIFTALTVAAIPAGLIMLQPDLGTTLVIGVTALGLLSVSGASARWLLGLGGGAIVGVVTVMAIPGLLKDYQKDRLTVFLDPNIDPLNAGYNLIQVKLAIGSGGLFGTGLFQGPQTNGRFVPEQQTDFIYSAAGEELGFVGAAAIIILLFIVVWRALRIASQATDRFGRIAATGIACWISFQAFENIGMNLGIMPATGVPLPFISYGGSSLLALWMAIGLLQNIKMKITD
ncbi:MAG: hypothetical protein RIS75_271 [Actinomycetota bacterium]